jgi:hypothetical protein
MTKGDYLIIIGLINVILLLGLKIQPAISQSLIENVSSGNTSMINNNNTEESLAEKVIDPESLMLGAPDRDQENDTLGRVFGECGIIKPSSEMEEGEKMAECQERILNETNTATNTEEMKVD